MQAASDRILGFMVGEYYDFPLLNPFCRMVNCIPVNRDGRDSPPRQPRCGPSRTAACSRSFPKAISSLSPAGALTTMKPGTAYLALHSGVPVIPAYLCGTPETNDILKSLLTPSKARVVFGEPIDLSDIPANRPADKAAQAEVNERFKAAFLALQKQAFAPDK